MSSRRWAALERVNATKASGWTLKVMDVFKKLLDSLNTYRDPNAGEILTTTKTNEHMYASTSVAYYDLHFGLLLSAASSHIWFHYLIRAFHSIDLFVGSFNYQVVLVFRFKCCHLPLCSVENNQLWFT